MSLLNWKTTKAEYELISAIADRGEGIAMRHHIPYYRRDAFMDITAVHCNGNPLRLADLLAADEHNFTHDLWGIQRHIDRQTGKLGDCFVPRYSAREEP